MGCDSWLVAWKEFEPWGDVFICALGLSNDASDKCLDGSGAFSREGSIAGKSAGTWWELD